MTETPSQPGKDPIGTVADEARKLFDTIQGRATRQVGKSVLGSFTGGGRQDRGDVWSEAVSEHDEYICRACPWCRAIAAQREAGGLRESGADVAEHLAAAGGELFAAFRQALDTLSRPAPRRRPADETRQNVEHIDLG
ncbi:hypothetical protein ACIBH1_08180 [Nonomuraea sp. NPDC050663]|uniref:hypothetical protein n=1 Tax=Nonomuraea sp. NPDC050663 TaxID=3364370 RepID=UPI00181A4642|nr:hypothetical protein [Thermoactinospora sp.]